MSAQHKFQNYHAKDSGGLVLNVGCKEDPAKIYECGEKVINLDIMDHDPHTNINMAKDVPGFVKADFLEWEDGQPYSFDTVVIGEVLEHCDENIIYQFLNKAHMLLKEDGNLIITVPHDPRPKNEQYSRPAEYYTHRKGISSWHRTLVTRDFIEKALVREGFKVHLYERADWDHHHDMYWHMIVAKKDENFEIAEQEDLQKTRNLFDEVTDDDPEKEEECQQSPSLNSENGSEESSKSDTPADTSASTTADPSPDEESQTSTSSTKEDSTPSN